MVDILGDLYKLYYFYWNVYVCICQYCSAATSVFHLLKHYHRWFSASPYNQELNAYVYILWMFHYAILSMHHMKSVQVSINVIARTVVFRINR